jgi:hypothetical protein
VTHHLSPRAALFLELRDLVQGPGVEPRNLPPYGGCSALSYPCLNCQRRGRQDSNLRPSGVNQMLYQAAEAALSYAPLCLLEKRQPPQDPADLSSISRRLQSDSRRRPAMRFVGLTDQLVRDPSDRQGVSHVKQAPNVGHG